MANSHSIVWMDHQKAVIWNFTEDAQAKSVVKAHGQHEHTHHRNSSHGGHKAPDDVEFFEGVAKGLVGAGEIIVIGPAHAKQEFVAFLQKKHPKIGAAIVAVDTADHPTDAQLLAYAKKHFKAIDRMI